VLRVLVQHFNTQESARDAPNEAPNIIYNEQQSSSTNIVRKFSFT